ncbi:MAG: glycosyltransferase family 4 protein [Natrialbaceae archaeon]|nr:glycosyltransferase family 4 protein [Natrialbaceae archaeon]
MNIGIVTPRYPPTHAGGGEISAQLLAGQLLEHADVDTVTVFSFDGNRTETIEGVPVRRLSDVPQYPYTLPNEIAYRKLKAFELECDILHGYNMHLHPTVGRISAARGIPSVATLNAYPLIDWGDIGINPSTQRRIYERTLLRLERPRLKRHMRNVNRFLPLSSAVERVYRANGFADSEFQVVPNMLDPAFAVPDRLNDTDEKDGLVNLLYVGYLRDSKGVRHLIDAMDLLPSTYILQIVGDGPTRASLEARADRRETGGRIQFTGKVPYDEVTRAYATADVFVHPGVWPEPFGRTILEAMQAGLPVVATDVGGPGETVPQQDLRCPPGDPSALAVAIERAVENRDAIGAENESYVYETFHPSEVVPQFLETYRTVLADY